MKVSIARKNVFHQKGKLALSLLSIGASLALILILLGFREGLYAALTAYVNNMGADLIVAQNGVEGLVSSSSVLPTSIHAQIEELAGATEAGHVLVAGAIFTREETKTPIILVGYVPDSNIGAPWKLGQGRYLEGDNEIMLDTWLAHRTGVQIGDEVDLFGRNFEVVGLTRETASWMSPYVFISLKAAQKSLGLVGSVSFHILRLPEGANSEDAIKAIKSGILNVDVFSPNKIAETDRRVIAAVMDRPISVLILVAIIIGIAVMGLTSYTAIADRMREYSLLKAVGASWIQLTGLIVWESLYHAVLALLVGIGLAYLTAFFIMANWPQFNVLIRPDSVLLVAILAIVMTVFSALMPLRRLSQIDPLEAFRA